MKFIQPFLVVFLVVSSVGSAAFSADTIEKVITSRPRAGPAPPPPGIPGEPRKKRRVRRGPSSTQSILDKLAPMYGQILSKPVPAKGEDLTLAKAIERAIAHNRSMEQTRISLKQSKLSYNDAFDTMFMPALNLVYDSAASLTVAHIPGALHDSEGKTNVTQGYPNQSLSLQLGSYTIFNFWKDYDAYEQARLDWVRTNEQFKEQVRALTNQVTVAYYKYRTELEKMDASQRSVSISEAFVEVVKSQIKIGKATPNDLLSAQVDLNNARSSLIQQANTVKTQLWATNILLGDPVGTPYTVKDVLKFVPIAITPEAALKIYMENAPNMKDRRKEIKKAELALDLAQKNRLPLPKIAFSGVNLSYSNPYNYYQSTLMTPDSHADLNVSAQINLTLPLYGPGGFLNGRVVAQSELALDSANLAFTTTTYSDEVTIRQTIQQVSQIEQNIALNSETFQKSLSILETMSGTIASGQINRLEQRDAINNARNSELQLEDLKVQHLQTKLEIAQLIGLDRLPGDEF